MQSRRAAHLPTSIFSLVLLVAMVIGTPLRLPVCAAVCASPASHEAPVSCCAPAPEPVCPTSPGSALPDCCFREVGFAQETVLSEPRAEASEPDATEASPATAHWFFPALLYSAPRESPAARGDGPPLPAIHSRIHLLWCVLLR